MGAGLCAPKCPLCVVAIGGLAVGSLWIHRTVFVLLLLCMASFASVLRSRGARMASVLLWAGSYGTMTAAALWLAHSTPMRAVWLGAALASSLIAQWHTKQCACATPWAAALPTAHRLRSFLRLVANAPRAGSPEAAPQPPCRPAQDQGFGRL
jgi:hypothetical protein